MSTEHAEGAAISIARDSDAEPNGSSASRVPAIVELPRCLGRYELLHELASGGMATVYLGRARGIAGFQRLVAIKCCHPHLRNADQFVAMFLDEARLAARIHHPNVVSTLDVGEVDEASLYLVMEFVDGFSLTQVARAAARQGIPVPIDVSLRVMIDMLTGLQAAHDLRDGAGVPLNLVHRDISPQNVLVGTDGIARLTDFGIAKADARSAVTAEGQLKGKLAYMAPEQLRSDMAVTRHSDIYAAGVVLWELLTGKRLFSAKSEVETFRLVLEGSIPHPAEIVFEVNAKLDAAVMKALARGKDYRYRSAEAFAEALESCGHPVASARAVTAFLRRAMPREIAYRAELLQRIAAMPSTDSPKTVRVMTGARLANATARWHPGTEASQPNNAEPAVTLSERSTLKGILRRQLSVPPRAPAWVGLGSFVVLVAAIVALAVTPASRTSVAAGASPRRPSPVTRQGFTPEGDPVQRTPAVHPERSSASEPVPASEAPPASPARATAPTEAATAPSSTPAPAPAPSALTATTPSAPAAPAASAAPGAPGRVRRPAVRRTHPPPTTFRPTAI